MKKNKKAFTLIELLVSTVILVILLAALFFVLSSGDSSFHMDEGLLVLQQEARSATETMVRELRQTTATTIPSSSRIDFTTAQGNISYYRNAAQNQIIREFPSGTTRVIANNITSLSFCCWHDDTASCTTNCSGSNLVEISLTANRDVRGRNLSFSFKGQAKKRNE